jgi:hypothetical protein
MDPKVLTTFITSIAAISIAAERIVEILKGWFPNLPLFSTKSDPASEMRRCAFIHVLAGTCGALVSWLGQIDVFQDIAPKGEHWVKYLVTGLLSSAGSAFWNHFLDFVKATKIKKEQAAIDAVGHNQEKHLLTPAHPASFAFAMAANHSLPAVLTATTGTNAACVIQPDPATGGFLAPRGVLTFKLNVLQGSFNFVPTGCSAKDPSNNAVTFSQKTTNILQFTASTPGAYSLIVLYSFTPGSRAQLFESCPLAQPLDDLDSTVGVPTIYPIQIS